MLGSEKYATTYVYIPQNVGNHKSLVQILTP